MGFNFNPLIFSGLDLSGGGAAGSPEWREPVANEAALPLVGNSNGEARVTLDTDKIYVWDATSSRWVDTGITAAAFGASPNANGQTIGVDDSTANIRRRTLTLQPANATNPGGVSTTSQSFAGAKTFLDQVKIDEASNQLVLGTTTTTTITAPNPAANRTVTIPDAGTNSSVVLTESNQTINGTKTFSSTVLTNGGIDVAATVGTDTLTIGGTNADVINVGRSGITINLIGTTINQDVTNLNVDDKNITVNSGGAAGSGATAGIDVEEAGNITGYVEVSGDRNSWLLKAPNTVGVATITPGASGITLNQSSHDPVTLTAVGSTPNANGASLSGQQLTLQPANGTSPGVITSGTQTLGGLKTFNNGVTVVGTTTVDHIVSVDYIDFDQTAAVTPATARLRWDDTAGTLRLGLKGGNVSLDVGEQVYQRVVNVTGSPLLRGKVVKVDGSQGNNVTVSYAQANNDINSATILGIVAEDIPDSQVGFIIAEGTIRNLNTGSFLDGDILYLSPTTPGEVTKVKPIAPDHLVIIGYCVKANNGSGQILVKTQNGYELGELHDVKITLPESNGQLLIYNASTPAWENHTLTAGTGISVTNGAGSITLASSGIIAPYDIAPTSFTALDNQAVAQNITGFLFSSANVRGFEATVSVTRGTNYATYKLYGINKAGSFEMSQEFVGDITGISFSVTSLGQIQYTSTSTGNNATIKFRGISTQV